MSKDIRSYFSKSSSSGKPKIEDSPKGKKRSRRVIESDDESEDLSFINKKHKESTKSKPEKKKQEVVVKVENFFGNTPIVQKKQEIKHVKKNVEKKEKKASKKAKKEANSCEVSFENDDELEASLLQTDDEQLVTGLLSSGKKNNLNVSKEEKKTPQKESVDSFKQKKTPQKETDDSTKQKKTPKKETDDLSKQKKTPNKTPNKTPKRENGKSDNIPSSDQKKKNAEAYQKYLHRSGPKNPGSKVIPEGTPTCLQGLAFVITGVLDSLEREEAVELIQKCGGRVTGQVSKKTDYVVVGEEPGASKIQKAENFRTKMLNEDELLKLISDKSERGEKDNFVQGTPEKVSKYFEKDSGKKREKKMEEVKNETGASKLSKKEESKAKPEPKKVPVSLDKVNVPSTSAPEVAEKPSLREMEKTGGDMLWVDKYKPKSTKNIIGQMGEKSNVKKLIKWLQNWHKNHSGKGNKKAAKPAPWAQNDDGSYFKAALLSGPPGVGKTTTVHLVCKELGFDIVEFNASDTRSKRLLQEEVSELLLNKSIRGYLKGTEDTYQRQVLVMDEVDGMAGNEDRGGIQELIQLIKNTRVPIVGICNDRNHPKMRSLVNYCFDLRFQRPRVEQIKGAMKSICFKENLDISGEALEELIVNSNHDVRQVLHTLSVLASGDKTLSVEEAKKKGEQAKKPLNLSPWDVARKVFSASEQDKMTFSEKTDLFFQDYSLGPLFIQDSYLRVNPYKAKNCEKKKLELISKAADSLVLGDVVERMIRSQNAWSLLPVQAIFSSVLPGHHMKGHMQGQIQFPVWLGKNSKSNRFERLLQDLHSSLRMTVTGSKDSTNLDYLHHLKSAIVRPLVEEGSNGVKTTVDFMLNYHLLREDLDAILELSTWPGTKDLFSEVDSKVKSALTRALNKEGQAVALKRGGKAKDDEAEEIEEPEDEEDDNIDLDPMIKKGKAKTKKEEEKTKKPTTKKGKEKVKK